jgi:hypothetical protein
MIADEKVGAKGVKVKCKKCAHIIIVKPQTADSPAQPESRDAGANGAAGFGDMFGDSFNGPTQAMSKEQLEALAASSAMGGALSAEPGDTPAEGGEGVAANGAGIAESAFGAPAGDEPFGGGSDSANGFGGGFGSANGAPSMSDLAGQAATGPETDLNLDAALRGEEQPAAPAPSSRPAGEKEWYVAIDESQIGPIDLHEIEQRWDSLEIDEDSLAWKAGMQDWLPIAEIADLAYLITERPQQKPATSFGTAAGASAGVGVAAGGGLAPVAFHGDSAGGSGSDVSWTPSAASALSSLVEDELTASPPPDAAEEAPPADSGMPSFGAKTLFGSGGNGGADAAPPAPDTAAPAVAPVADPFAGGGGTHWSMPKPKSGGGGIRPIHLALIGMGLLFVGLAAVVVVLFLRPPAAQPTEVAASSHVNTPPATAEQPRTPPASGAESTAAAAPAKRVVAPTPTPPSAPAEARRPRVKEKRPPREKSKKKANGGLDELLESPRPSRPAKEKLTREDIMAGVKKGSSAVSSCIKTGRAKGELTPGRHTLVLEWTILPSGKVSSPKLKGPSNVLGTSLPGCFARGMRRWSFPATEKGGPVRNFPFAFNIK